MMTSSTPLDVHVLVVVVDDVLEIKNERNKSNVRDDVVDAEPKVDDDRRRRDVAHDGARRRTVASRDDMICLNTQRDSSNKRE